MKMLYVLCVSYCILLVVAKNNNYESKSKIGIPTLNDDPIYKPCFEKLVRVDLDSQPDLNSAQKFRIEELRQAPPFNPEDKYILITEKYKGLKPYEQAGQQIDPLISPPYSPQNNVPSGVQKIYFNDNLNDLYQISPAEKIHRVLYKQNGQQNQQGKPSQRQVPTAQDSDSKQNEAARLYIPQYGQYKYRSVQPYYNRYGPIKLGTGSGAPVFYFVGDPNRKYVIPNMYKNDRNVYDKSVIDDNFGEKLKVNPKEGYYFVMPTKNKQPSVLATDDVFDPNSLPKTTCDNDQHNQNQNRNSRKNFINEEFIPVMKYNSDPHILYSKSNLNKAKFHNSKVRKKKKSRKRKTMSKRGFVSDIFDFFTRPFKKKGQIQEKIAPNDIEKNAPNNMEKMQKQLPAKNAAIDLQKTQPGSPEKNTANKIQPEKEVPVTNRPFISAEHYQQKPQQQLPEKNEPNKIQPEKEIITTRPYISKYFHKLKRIGEQRRNGNRIVGMRKLKY